MVDPHISSPLEHILPTMLPVISISENHGSNDSNGMHSLTPWMQSIFLSLLPVEDLKSRTGAAVVVDNIGSIFWDAFELQMHSDGREIGSCQFKDISRGFLMGYYDNISGKDQSQAPGSVFATMIQAQTCLKNAFGECGGVRKLGQLYGSIKAKAKSQLKANRSAKRPINTMLDWLNESVFSKQKDPEPPPPVSAPAPEPPAEEINEVEDLTLENPEESEPEPFTTLNEDQSDTGFFDPPEPPDPPPAAPHPPQGANQPNTPYCDPPGTRGVSERRWVWLKKG